ncbi:hypothetical protein LFT45_19190 [Arthrobacter sp. FW305-BF8]|uniref:hypothetical protein n=1 Tax=Arthrobacter sp. FW305-BF8 TaxID=2879617 RepID=UPI001F443FDE|nr:hypothetical protein [Arthrobacter sp. FW305-BF8]UKA53808.1 hypothetical protein LFT45_19190 [Arthrobacter sp. FW305-BF8]
MKIPRSELPAITAAVKTAPVKVIPDQPSGPAAAAGPRKTATTQAPPGHGSAAAAPSGAGARAQGDEVAAVPARANIGNWPDPM